MYNGIAVNPGPAIVFKPDFVCCPTEYSKVFPVPTSVKISARSTLVVRGSGVIIESLDLDGTLIIDYKGDEQVIIRKKKVQNAGWVRVKVDYSDNEIIKMRGYKIVRKDEERMEPSGCSVM
jgi:UDP-sugar pyrophosphorylase